MLNRLLTGLALTVSLLFGAPRALAGDDAPAALIARKDLFGNPVKAGAPSARTANGSLGSRRASIC